MELLIDRAALTDVACRVMDVSDGMLHAWDITPISHRVINRVTRGLYRVAGVLDTNGQQCDWSAVLKVLHRPDDDNTSAFNASDKPAHWNYWRREALVYQSNMLDDLPPGLAAPRCYAIEERSSSEVWLWLEDIHGTPATAWTLDRFGVAAQHIGQWQGSYCTPIPLPHEPWFSERWLRAWVPDEANARLDLVHDATLWQHPLLAKIFSQPMTDAVVRLWDVRTALLTAIEQAPRTICHLDVWPPNMFGRSSHEINTETVLIDWSQVGHGALAEDMANLVLDSVWMQRVDGHYIAQFEQVVYTGYIAGLRHAGWQGDERLVRFAYCAVAALRFGLLTGNVLAQADDAASDAVIEQKYGRAAADVIADRARVVAHALQCAEEAQALLPML